MSIKNNKKLGTTKPKSKRAESAIIENTTIKKNSVTVDKNAGSKARQLLARTLAPILKKMRYLKIIFFCVLAFPFLSRAQSDNKPIIKDTVDVTFTVYSHFTDILLESEEQSLEIGFDTITENQFNYFKANKTPKIDTSAIGVSRGTDSFLLTAADTTFIFRCENPRPCYNYHGYYPELNSYLIGAIGDGIYETFLIDRKTAKGLPIPSFFDDSGNNPLISPDKKLMLIYGTCRSDKKYCLTYLPYVSVIALVDISSKGQISDLKSYQMFETKDWVIDELIWIDNKNIALKIYDQTAFDYHGQDYKQNSIHLKGKMK